MRGSGSDPRADGTRRLEVRLCLEPGRERRLGLLAEQGRRIYFEYDPDFLRDPLWLSPFHLPPEPGLIEHRDREFGPIFGLFDDSLPDGWGLLLMDRFFRQQNRPLAGISVLDRLAYLGSRTMGALTYHPPADPTERDPRIVDLHALAHASEEVLAGRVEEVLPQLLRAGGSPGGARPKVLVGVRGDELISGEDRLPADFEPWLVKFGGRDDPADAGPIELAYAHMARDAGIEMPPTRLFETPEGGRFFGVRRFDRGTGEDAGEDAGRRFHVHTFGNLVHADFRVPSCDYHQLLDATRILTRSQRDVLRIFRRMVFNVLTHNRDDHVKNFAFRLGVEGEWQLAPAYDLVFSDGPGGEHSMTVDGEGRAPGRRHLLALARKASISEDEASEVIEEVGAAVRRWQQYAAEAGVSPESTARVDEALGTCLERV